MDPRTAHKVVVGVDGAPRTIAALRWAASEALRRDAELVAVHAWGSMVRPASYAPVGAGASPDECATQAAEVLAAAVRTAFGAAPPVPVRQVVDPRAVVPALLDHARDAELLVVATRTGAGARPGESGPGSTTLSCLRQAPCPVVVLPTDMVRAQPVGAGAAARWRRPRRASGASPARARSRCPACAGRRARWWCCRRWATGWPWSRGHRPWCESLTRGRLITNRPREDS
jgi:nucleotide-binding universal stress UspA family protein